MTVDKILKRAKETKDTIMGVRFKKTDIEKIKVSADKIGVPMSTLIYMIVKKEIIDK